MKNLYFILYQKIHKGPTRYDTVIEVETKKNKALERINILKRNRFKPILLSGVALSGNFKDFKTIEMYEDGIDRRGLTAELVNSYFKL